MDRRGPLSSAESMKSGKAQHTEKQKLSGKEGGIGLNGRKKNYRSDTGKLRKVF